jgi:hypothetical protein
MRRFAFYLGVVLLGLVVHGCRSGQLMVHPAEMAPSGGGATAGLVVLRESQIPGASVLVNFELDGIQIATLGPGDYVELRVAPGDHFLAVGFAGQEQVARFTIAAGEQRYYLFDFGMFRSTGIDALQPIAEAEGRKRVASGTYDRLETPD